MHSKPAKQDFIICLTFFHVWLTSQTTVPCWLPVSWWQTYSGTLRLVVASSAEEIVEPKGFQVAESRCQTQMVSMGLVCFPNTGIIGIERSVKIILGQKERGEHQGMAVKPQQDWQWRKETNKVIVIVHLAIHVWEKIWILYSGASPTEWL